MTQGRPGIETRDSSDSPNERLTQPTKRRAVGNKEARGRAGGTRPGRLAARGGPLAQKQKGSWLEPGPFEHPMAGYAGLEPATSDVTGRRSNQLS